MSVRPVTHISAVLALVLAALMSSTGSVAAQDRPAPKRVVSDSSVTQVRLRDGTVLYGRVMQEDSARVRFRTTVGAELELTRDQIATIRTTDGQVVDGQFWPEDPNATRLLFTSTGRPLAKGEGYLSAYFLFLPFVGVGITDRFTLAGGTPIIPEAMGKVFYLAPKYTVINRPRQQFAIGALSFATTEDFGDNGTVGVAYGVGTFGDHNNALTVGAGWGYQWGNGTASMSNSPVGVIGGELRASRRTKFITENWIFDGGAVLSGGVRFIGDRLSADLGAMGAAGDDFGCCIPTVNFMWNFGRERRARR